MKNIFINFKKKIIKYLEKMAEVNKKNFGTKKLDCCNMNKEMYKNNDMDHN